MRTICFTLCLVATTLLGSRALAADVTTTRTDGQIEFKVDGKLFTRYVYDGTVQLEKATGTKPLAKPFFFPVFAPCGETVTRGWPIDRSVAKDSTDHFHQKSVWFCHGDVIPEGIELKTRSADKHVKGVDFWAEGAGHGRIVCTKIDVQPGAKIVSTNEWRTPDDVTILTERRTIEVRATPVGRLIVLGITLEPTVSAVTFGDTKEGAMGVRVSDLFRLQNASGKGTITTAEGQSATAPAKDNLPLWGQLSAWHDYSGVVNGKPVGLAVFADPENTQKSAWHSRAYGLMAANPFARTASGFPGRKGQTELVKLSKGERLQLRYGIYAHDGDAEAGKVAEAFSNFAKH